MKFINAVDSLWHPMGEEMPPTTTKVEFKKKSDDSIVEGMIVVEMSGYFAYLNPEWGSLEDYSHWRFAGKGGER